MSSATINATDIHLAKLEARILGVRVHGISRALAVAWIDAWLASRARAQVVTVNPEILMRARRDPDYGELLERTRLNLPDGAGIVAAARLRRLSMPERVTGVDLVDDLAGLAAVHGYRLLLAGAAPGVADQAAAELQRRYPGLIPPATMVGRSGPDGDAEAQAVIQETRPHIVLAAYGAPAQEFWIDRNLRDLAPVVGIGVGGTLDYLAGRIPRAPAPLRRIGLEWAYRLARQPWRWRRMRALPAFARLAILEALGLKIGVR
ncbi:MAG: WecB/TagA/CpsF family glycosyltransferase [Chloroflexota bacterium]|nr:WecB/TagA/CpsF family glycosyltransferase [Chloroflexota bacterium]